MKVEISVVARSMAIIPPLGERTAPGGEEEQREPLSIPLPGEREAPEEGVWQRDPPGIPRPGEREVLGEEETTLPGGDGTDRGARPQGEGPHLLRRRNITVLAVVVMELANITQAKGMVARIVVSHTTVHLAVVMAPVVPAGAMEELRMAMEDPRHQDRVVMPITHPLIHPAIKVLQNATLTITLLTSWKLAVFQCSVARL